MHLITGLLLGLSTLLFIGPVLFYLINTSIYRGRMAGYQVALGIITGDIIIVVASFYGGRQLFTNIEFLFWFGLLGGVILFVLGLNYLLKKPGAPTTTTSRLKSFKNPFVNGFLVNFVNPFVFAVWIGFIAYNESMYSATQTVVSLTVTLAVIFSTDMLKAYYAEKLQRIIRPRTLSIVHKTVGLLMLIFALRLFLYAYWSEASPLSG